VVSQQVLIRLFLFKEIKFAGIYSVSERIFDPKVSITRILVFRKIIVKSVNWLV